MLLDRITFKKHNGILSNLPFVESILEVGRKVMHHSVQVIGISRIDSES